MTRREFISLAFLASAASVSACRVEPEVPDNSVLLYTLRENLGITASTTRDQLAADAAKYMNDPSWKTNTSFGVYHAKNGVDIPIALDTYGQLMKIVLDEANLQHVAAFKAFTSLKYPSVPTEPNLSSFQIDYDFGKPVDVQVVTYGALGTISRLGDKGESLFRDFFQESLAFVDTGHISLHINCLPSGVVSFLDVGERDYVPPSDAFGAHMHVTPHSEEQTLPLKGLDIYLNLYILNREALIFGQTYDELFLQTWTNEVIGLLGRLHPKFNVKGDFINEAHSTLVSWLAFLDRGVATLVLNGEEYIASAASLGAEMVELAKIGAK